MGLISSPRRRLRRLVCIAVAAAVLTGACGGGGGGEARKISEIERTTLPPTLMGMQVKREDIDKLIKQARRPYIDQLGLFSFRREELLQATLQVSRFSDDAKWDTTNFRRTVAGQILGMGNELSDFRMGDDKVFLGGNARQVLAVWFEGPYMLVMAARNDFEEPRGLLRRLVELRIGGGSGS